MAFAHPVPDQAPLAVLARGEHSLADIAFESLRDAIVEGRLPPEEPIRQELIAARLGVSKIPLREALTRLEREGLVRSQRNRGFAVAPLSRVEAFEILVLRLRIEPHLVGQACEWATAEERLAAVAAFEALRRAGNAPGTDGLVHAYRHRLYVAGAGALVVGVADRLAHLSDRYRIAYDLGRTDATSPAEEALLGAWIDARRPVVEEACTARLIKLIEALGRLN